MLQIAAFYHRWRKLLVNSRVSGAQVHDARLVASMHVYDVKRILTFNIKDFARFNDLSGASDSYDSGQVTSNDGTSRFSR